MFNHRIIGAEYIGDENRAVLVWKTYRTMGGMLQFLYRQEPVRGPVSFLRNLLNSYCIDH